MAEVYITEYVHNTVYTFHNSLITALGWGNVPIAKCLDWSMTMQNSMLWFRFQLISLCGIFI